MKTSHLKAVFLGTTLFASAITLAPAAVAGGKDRMYRVTITNATLGQPIAPSVIATHNRSFRLFELGAAPMPEDSNYDDYFALAAMAETGYPFHVLDQVSNAYGVWEAKVLATDHTPPVIFPGESNSTTISAPISARHLSAVGMLGKTNDALYAIHGAELPWRVGQTTRALATAYDAGSEANAETAATIGALGAMDDDPVSGTGINEGGEGYIHVHSGVHGMGDLSTATDDWRNPVVEVTIERIR